jgi:hypothetical protein
VLGKGVQSTIGSLATEGANRLEEMSSLLLISLFLRRAAV